jgi:hypothetical protein
MPMLREFLKFSGIPGRHLITLFGRDAYTKLQVECGDEPNKLNLERTPTAIIMKQYGELALKIGGLPYSSDWTGAGCTPTRDGLLASPHRIKWQDFPARFKEWVETGQVKCSDLVLEWISRSTSKKEAKTEKVDRDFDHLVMSIRTWSPALRRNNEESYKIELRKHLESLSYALDEEYGESNCDLVVSSV